MIVGLFNIFKIFLTLENIEYNHTKTKNSHNYPDASVDKGNFITDNNEIVNQFNEYIANVGMCKVLRSVAGHCAISNIRLSVLPPSATIS